MQSTRSRFIGVALLVCLFAVGMATFLNFYKYQATFEQLVRTRMLVIGYGVENSIQGSLNIGLAFNELTTVPALLARESKADPLITGIDVFTTDGKVLYSTDARRVGRKVADNWLGAAVALKGKAREFVAEDPSELVAGISLKNNFDLTVGYLAMRYDHGYVDRNVGEMGRRLVLIGIATLVAAVAVLALLLTLLLRRYERDMQAIGDRLSGNGPAAAVPQAFAPAVEELRAAVADADEGLARVRAGLGAR